MTPISSRIALATVLSLSVVAFPVHAQEQTSAQEDSGDEQPDDDLHNRQSDYQGNIIVSAQGLRQLDLLAGTDVLEAADIQRNLNGQIGEVLVKLPGVSATSFSPGASRPVLRGFEGERVRVLVDGLGSADVSNTSADHAVSINPLTAERIEVLRGPASLIYGSQAIGGVVNVIDKRIPSRLPDEDFHFDALVAGDSASNLRSGSGSLDVPIGGVLVAHIDGSWQETDDLEIGGFQASDSLRADLFALADEEEAEGELGEAEELREAADQRGFIPNSATETWSLNGGLGVVLGESSFGFSVGYYDTSYGIPGRPGFEEHHGHGEGGEEAGEEEGEEEGVSIGLEQFRADFSGDIALGEGFFQRLKIRAGYSDYTHTEFEGSEVGTVFNSDALEGRIELVQSETGASSGAIGLQYTYRDFEAIGEEAFVAPNTTDQIAIFGLQEFDFGGFQIEGAARYEMVDVESRPLGVKRDFDLFSGALSLVYAPVGPEELRIGLTGSRAERAPSGEELFANGPHIATQAFEIGDTNLTTESAWGLEAFARGKVGGADFNVAIFKQWFDNYIYLTATGAEEDDLPVFQIFQQGADYSGVEGEVSFPLADIGGFGLITDLRGSYVRAELNDGNNVPRIPPLELLGALELQSDALDLRGEVQWFAEQDRISAFETPTDDFAFVNLLASWQPLGDRSITLQLAADNIFDVTGRRHASFTKDYVPLAGRNVKASVRLSF